MPTPAPTPRYALHPSILRMGGTSADAKAYLKEAPTLVEAMYAGGKAGLRPLHDMLEQLAWSLGEDIKLCPAKTIVPIYREHVIAQIKPTTRTRIDFGLALGSMKGTGRLLETGGFARKDRITHRVEITAPEDVTAEVRHWLTLAYERDS